MTPLPPSHIALTIRHAQDKLPVREVLLDEEGGTIGRAPANTVALTGDANVSLVHATLELIGSRWVLKDIGDLVPVMRNGRPLGFGHRCDIGDGEQFSIASFDLEVCLDPARIASLAARQSQVVDLPVVPQTLPPLTHNEVIRPAIPPAVQGSHPPLPRPSQDEAPFTASELQRLHQDPFAQPAYSNNARNFVGDADRLLDGVLPGIEQNHATALANPLHREANLDPLRHRTESIDALFSLEAGQGVDPLAEILGGANPASFVAQVSDDDPIMAVLNQQLGGSASQSGSERHSSTDFNTSLNLPKAGSSTK